MNHQLSYRPEIDGLRAIAILAVVLFHGGFGCSGGYVGVDVFFVISGFLITSLIRKDLEGENFTFANFWERRARRIVPALMVVTLATLAAACFIMLPTDLIHLGYASAVQVVFGANFYYHYRLDTGYFAENASEKPLLHTWSLAVEEQFYVIIPFVIWAIFRMGKGRHQAVILSLLSLAFVLSLALSVYAVARHPSAAFYFLPSRAWELLLGSITAYLPYPLVLGHRIFRETFSMAGFALILFCIFCYTPQTPFPGLTALPPCLGAAMLIWSNQRVNRNLTTLTGIFLAFRPLVFIGLISYSLYLWHWPFLAFSKYLSLGPVSTAQSAIMLGSGFLLAILSWKYVETPFRRRSRAASRKSMFAWAGVGLTVMLGGGMLCILMQGFPGRFSREVLEFVHARADMPFLNEFTAKDVQAGKLVSIGKADPALPVTVLVWGDSHAMAALPAVDAFLKEKNLAGQAATHSATPPVLGWYKIHGYSLGSESIAYNDAVLSHIENHHIPEVILIARWNIYTGNDGHNSKNLDSALIATVQRIVAAGSRPWIMLDVPNHSFDIPTALFRKTNSPEHVKSLCAKPAVYHELGEDDRKTIAEIEGAGGRVLDPKPCFLDPTGLFYMIYADGSSLYRDSNHVTTKGAKLILLPFLREFLPLKKQ